MAGLGFGAILNAYSTRATFLCAITFIFLFIVPYILPDPNSVADLWFVVLVLTECLFGLVAISTRTRCGVAVAGFSLWNSIGNLFGLACYHYDLSLYTAYGPIIQAGETAQVMSLIVMSRPVINLAIYIATGKQGESDGWQRNQPSPS